MTFQTINYAPYKKTWHPEVGKIYSIASNTKRIMLVSFEDDGQYYDCYIQNIDDSKSVIEHKRIPKFGDHGVIKL